MAQATDPAHGMEYGHYYVVEASFAPANPVARYVAYAASEDGYARLTGGGRDDDGFVRLAALAFFQVVEQVTALSARPSRFMPLDRPEPASAPAAANQPDAGLVSVLRRLLDWEMTTGGWDAPCWKAARAAMRRLDRASRPEGERETPQVRARLSEAIGTQGWNDSSVAQVLADFIDREAQADPDVAGRLCDYLAERIEDEDSAGVDA